MLYTDNDVSAAYEWLEERVKGSEDGTIPAIPLTEPLDAAHLVENLRVLDNRKISNGYSDGTPADDGLPDGVSLARVLCDPTYSPTTLVDDNVGWVMNNAADFRLLSRLEKVFLGCEVIYPTAFLRAPNVLLIDTQLVYYLPSLKKIIPKESNIGFIQSIISAKQECDIYCPELEEITKGERFGFVGGLGGTGETSSTLYGIYLPKLRRCRDYLFNSYQANQSTGVNKVILGAIEVVNEDNAFNPYNYYRSILFTPNLIHFEFGYGTSVNINLRRYSPTNALRTDTDAEDYVDLREDMSFANNLQQFLSNFKTYIAERLSEQGSGLTLTLSQAVRDAIEGDPTIAQIITSKGWTISPAPTA